MKKISFLLFSLIAVTMFTSCINDDDPVNEQTVIMLINSRAIDGDNVVFSQSSAKATFNLVDMTTAFTCVYKDANGQSRTVTTPVMKMTATSTNSSIYRFEGVISQTVSGIETITGYIDMATLMTWFTISDYNGSPVVCTSQPNYIYATTTVTNPDDGKNYSHKQSSYLFAIDDAQGGSCILQIKNFIPNTSGLIQADVIQFNDLKVTPTPEGYLISADEAESSLSGYTITDLNIILNSQCRVIDGSFKCEGLTFEVKGELFPTSNP